MFSGLCRADLEDLERGQTMETDTVYVPIRVEHAVWENVWDHISKLLFKILGNNQNQYMKTYNTTLLRQKKYR